MRSLKFLCLICWFTNIQASTHWMVTESGLIQPKADSPFVMARPYDLLAFLNQDTRWENIKILYHELSKKQEVINKLWTSLQKESDINTQLSIDDNCIRAGPLHLIEWYTTYLDDGRTRRINPDDFMLRNIKNLGEIDVPDCKKISSLTFSMFSFDHLEGVIQRENLTASPELTLPEQISPIMTEDQFGHWLAGTLRKNSSSWLHYNMASLYWRVRGNAAKAIECSRRAIHYAPREFKDVALQSMGSALHRSGKPEDAIIVLGAAVDHDPYFPVNHLVLGNAYAIFGDYNSSLKHLDECLKLNPYFDIAVSKHKDGVYCHMKLLQIILSMQELLKNLRMELREYSSKESHWLKSQAAFLRTMKHAEEFDYKVVEKNCIKMAELTGLDIKSVKKKGDKNSLIQYFLESSLFNENWLKERGVHAINSAYSFYRFVRHIMKHSNMVSDFVLQTDHLRFIEESSMHDIDPNVIKMHKVEASVGKVTRKVSQKAPEDTSSGSKIVNDIFQYETGIVLYPPTMKISRNSEDFDKEPDWPTLRHCKENARYFPENIDAVFPTFLPFENKGLRLKSLLTSKIGVPADVEHDLPWYPPTCPQNKEAATYTQKKTQRTQTPSDLAASAYLKQKLLDYVADGQMAQVKNMQDAEIGHRIYVAMQMKLAPKWLLYTISSLYWRVRGNNINALHCLMTASRSVETRYKDIVLASLSSVYLEMGYFEESLAAAEEAFKLSLYEPTTNFILAELSMMKKHRNTQLFHLKQVLRVEPEYMNGFARNLLNGWACIVKQVALDLEFNEGDVCTQVKPEMVCEKDGSNCHMTSIQCFTSHDREGESNMIRMIDRKAEHTQHPSTDLLDANIFNQFIYNMPVDRRDKIAHRLNFEAMNKVFDKTLKSCGEKGCNNMQPEHLSMKESDCNYQHVQLGYWLHSVSFKQAFSESDLGLPPEISSMVPSSRQIPECRLQADASEDFFQERLLRIDKEGWKPLLSIMDQLVDMFSVFEYVTLGAKIAKYVETRPQSWPGLVAAGWWCGARGRGACAARCLAAAHRLAPAHRAFHATTALSALLHMQGKLKDARDVAYISFYATPKSKVEAFLVAVSHTYLSEYEQAVWMYRYALTFDDKYLPAKACLHTTMCLMLFGKNIKTNPKLI